MKTAALFLMLVFSASAIRAQSPQPFKPVTGRLEVTGGSIYYETHGSGAAVVLLHGGFGDRRMWDDQFRVFAREFQVVRYDQRGFGQSTRPETAYSPVEDLLRLLDHLKIKKAHLVGNSMGGGLVLDFALKHPDRVASLVVVASGPNGYPVDDKEVADVVAVFNAARKEGADKAAEMWMAHPMVAVTIKKKGAGQRLRTMINENKGIFTMNHWPSEPMEPPAAKRLREITAPTMILWGARDTAVVRNQADYSVKEIRGAKKVVMPGADHLPQMVNPAEFNRIVLGFLRSL